MMKRPCCSRSKAPHSPRGLCARCERIPTPKVHTIESALVTVADGATRNPVGAARLAAWAIRREAHFIDLRFEQGPAACASMLRG
jgi:hypothetical protein